MSLHFAIDVDGVLADFVGATLTDLAIQGGPSLTPEDITTWQILDHLPEGWRKSTEAMWMRAGWCSNLNTYSGAEDAVNALRNLGEVHFLTSPFPGSKFWLGERMDWLRFYFDATDADVTFTHKKPRYLADLLVDDKASTVVEYARKHPTALSVLWSQPWNASVATLDPPTSVVRRDRWDDVFDLVGEMLDARRSA